MSPLGNRIRELREQAGLTRKQLAERAHTSLSNIYMIERGDRPTIGFDLACRFADALGCTTDALRTPETILHNPAKQC